MVGGRGGVQQAERQQASGNHARNRGSHDGGKCKKENVIFTSTLSDDVNCASFLSGGVSRPVCFRALQFLSVSLGGFCGDRQAPPPVDREDPCEHPRFQMETLSKALPLFLPQGISIRAVRADCTRADRVGLTPGSPNYLHSLPDLGEGQPDRGFDRCIPRLGRGGPREIAPPWGCLPAPRGGETQSLGTGVGQRYRLLRGQIPVVSRETCLVRRLFALESRLWPRHLPNRASLRGQGGTPQAPPALRA